MSSSFTNPVFRTVLIGMGVLVALLFAGKDGAGSAVALTLIVAGALVTLQVVMALVFIIPSEESRPHRSELMVGVVGILALGSAVVAMNISGLSKSSDSAVTSGTPGMVETPIPAVTSDMPAPAAPVTAPAAPQSDAIDNLNAQAAEKVNQKDYAGAAVIYDRSFAEWKSNPSAESDVRRGATILSAMTNTKVAAGQGTAALQSFVSELNGFKTRFPNAVAEYAGLCVQAGTIAGNQNLLQDSITWFNRGLEAMTQLEQVPAAERASVLAKRAISEARVPLKSEATASLAEARRLLETAPDENTAENLKKLDAIAVQYGLTGPVTVSVEGRKP